MDINLRHLVDPSQFARTAATAREALDKPHKTDPYYTANNGHYAAKVVAAWRAAGFTPQHIRHADMFVTSRSLIAKIRGGIDWNMAHADTTEQQQFWETLRRELRFRKHDGQTTTMYRETEVAFVMKPAVSEDFHLQLRSALIDWALKAQPGAKFHKVGLDLSLEDVAWFQAKLDEPAWAETFVGFAKANEIRVIRTEAPITQSLDE